MFYARKSNRFISVIFVFSLILSLSVDVSAQPEQILVGARPLSMGGAFVAVANDGNAIMWNPAGLAKMERIQASFNHSDVFGLGLESTYFSFISRLYLVPALTDIFTIGVDWFSIRTPSDDELDFQRNQFHFSLGLTPQNLPLIGNFMPKDLSIGANLKYLTFTTEFDDITAADAQGWGWDVGFMYDLGARKYIPDGLNFGLMIHDIAGTEVKHDTGISEEILPQNIRWGFSYQQQFDYAIISDIVLALDFDNALHFDDRLHLGLELWSEKFLGLNLGLRAGYQKELKKDKESIFSFGIGLKMSTKDHIEVDYGFVNTPISNSADKQVAVTIVGKNNPRLIRIEEAHINDITASHYKYYRKPSSEFGKIKLKNVHDDTLEAQISFKTHDKKYTELFEFPTKIRIPPKTTIDHELLANFTHDILSTNKDRLTGEIEVHYRYRDEEYPTKKSVVFGLHEKNVLTWDDIAKACAFVTPRDSIVLAFTKKVIQLTKDNDRFISDKLTKAIAIFEALSIYGLDYVSDPTFPQVKRTTHYFDTVQYPNEILNKRNLLGDCDDLSVVYSSLMESVGIHTALISVPGHLFMMFDTGVLSNQRNRLLVENSMLIEHNGKIWIPIETTLINSDFTKAWQEGAKRFYNEKVDSTYEILKIEDGWRKYEPTSPKPLSDTLYKEFSFANLNDRIDSKLNEIKNMNQKFLERNFYSILKKNPDNHRVRNLLGTLYAQNGSIDQAKNEFENILGKDSLNFSSLSNLANLYFMEVENDTTAYGKAVKKYQDAIDVDESNPGVYLNLSFLHQWKMSKYNENSDEYLRYEEASEEALKRAGQLLIQGGIFQDREQALALLGLQIDFMDLTTKADESNFKSKVNKMRRFLMTKFKKVFKTKKQKQDEPAKKVAGAKASQPDEEWALILWWSS